MNTSWVLLYGGQGAQVAGMGQDLYQLAPAATPYPQFFGDHPAYERLFELSDEALAASFYAQPALILYDLTVWQWLARAGLEIGAAFGLSIGEFAALATAGVYSPAATIEIAVARAELMSQRLRARREAGYEDGMLALLGLETAVAVSLVERWPELSIANYNAPGQVVVSGPQAQFAELATEALAQGARRAVPLVVEGAFHSPIFAPDVPALSAVLRRFEAHPPALFLPLNLTGQAADLSPGQSASAYFSEVMSQQMAAPTHADQALDSLLAQGFTHFVEISPKPVLTPLLKRKDATLDLHNIRDRATLEAFCQSLNLHLEVSHDETSHSHHGG